MIEMSQDLTPSSNIVKLLVLFNQQSKAQCWFSAFWLENLLLFVDSFLAWATTSILCPTVKSRDLYISLGGSTGAIKPFIINYPHDHHYVSILLLRQASWVTQLFSSSPAGKISVCLSLSVFLWMCCFSYSPLNKIKTYSHARVSPTAGVFNAVDRRIFLCRTETFRDAADRLMCVNWVWKGC